jgi:hypothetical protein
MLMEEHVVTWNLDYSEDPNELHLKLWSGVLVHELQRKIKNQANYLLSEPNQRQGS